MPKEQLKSDTRRFVLASRSPRRRELLERIIPAGQIDVLPPRSADEPGFGGITDWTSIDVRLAEIAKSKCDDVIDQLQRIADGPNADDVAAVIAADTIIVVSCNRGRLTVLGQPPPGDSQSDTVRRWFRDYYAGRTHIAATGLCVASSASNVIERIVKSEVTFHADVGRRLGWYLETNEPRGKAGGYALQGAADIFISQVTGSLSNVIGLPLRALLDAFEELEIDVC